MTEQEKIAEVAHAMALSRGQPKPNSTDEDWAKRFVTAWQAMKAIEERGAQRAAGQAG